MDEALKDALGEQFGVSGRGVPLRRRARDGDNSWTDRPVRGTFWLVASAGLAGTLAWSIVDWADKDSKAEDYKNKDALHLPSRPSTTRGSNAPTRPSPIATTPRRAT